MYSIPQDYGINTLIVSDDGFGLPKDFALDKSTGTGITLVKGLTKQLEGESNILQNSGTSFII